MKFNIFKIENDKLVDLENKLVTTGMVVIQEVEQQGWNGKFYFSMKPQLEEIKWLEPYRAYFEELDPDEGELQLPKNQTHFAAFVLTKDDKCYALSHGKSHFYLRQFCHVDFGIDLARRIANENEVRQESARKFQGIRRKSIRSFAAQSGLGVESGESVDYIDAKILDVAREDFGKSGKFGASALLTIDVTVNSIGAILDRIEAQLVRDPLFSVPRTSEIKNLKEIARLDNLLLDALLGDKNDSELASSTFELYGVDFVFSTAGEFALSGFGRRRERFENLEVDDVREYVKTKGVGRDHVLDLRVTFLQDGRSSHSNSLKQCLEYVVDDENIALINGRWMAFNQDYLDVLNEFVDSIRRETVEEGLATIASTEPEFNKALEAYGYEYADRDFDIARTKASTPVEAWDHKKGDCVYAVKFGSAQDLGYVCDQAMGLLELKRNRAIVSDLPDFSKYCIWLIYEGANPLASIGESKSIILKQKIDAWARRCTELRIEPVLKLSHKPKTRAKKKN